MRYFFIAQVGTKQADVAMETERKRRVEETDNEEEISRRVNIANRLLDVQKELLSTHQQVKVEFMQLTDYLLKCIIILENNS